MEAALRKHVIAMRPFIDRRHQFLGFLNMKVCQMSVTRVTLKHKIIRFGLEPGKCTEYLQTAPIDDIFKFTIVRNPWDRVVSAFHFIQQRSTAGWEKDFQSFIEKRLLIQGLGLYRLFTPQYIRAAFDGKIFVDYIGRLESIENDWNHISNIIGCSSTLAHENISKHQDYRTYYNERSMQIVADMYREDIELFGYTF